MNITTVPSPFPYGNRTPTLEARRVAPAAALRPVSRTIALLMLSAIAALWMVPTTGSAQRSAPSTNVGPQPQESPGLLVPYENIGDVFQHGRRQIVIPFSEYEHLRNQVLGEEGGPACILNSAMYDAEVSQGHFRFTATLRVTVARRGTVQTIPLFSPEEVALIGTEMESDPSKEVPLVLADDRYALALREPGVYDVKLDGLVRPTYKGGVFTAKFVIPKAGLGQFDLKFPDTGAVPIIDPAYYPVAEKTDQGAEIHGLLSGRDTWEVRWRAKPAAGATAVSVSASEVVWLEDSDLVARLNAKFSAAGSFPPEMTLLLPPGWEFRSAKGDGISDWRVESSSDTMALRLPMPQEGDKASIEVVVRKAFDARAKETQVPVFHFPDTRRVEAYLLVVEPQFQKLHMVKTEGLVAIPPARFPSGVATPGIGQTFQIEHIPFQAYFALETIHPVFWSDLATRVTVGETLADVASNVRVVVTQGAIGTVDLFVPGDVTIDSVAGPSVRRWTEVSDSENAPGANDPADPATAGKAGAKSPGSSAAPGTAASSPAPPSYSSKPASGATEQPARRIHVEFSQLVSTSAQFTVAMDMPYGKAGFAMPEVRVDGAERERGAIGVIPAANVEIQPRDVKNLTPIDPSELPDSITKDSPRPAVAAFRYLAHPWSAHLDVSKHADVAVVTTVIESAVLTGAVAENGRILNELILKVKNTTGQYLSVNLPRGAAIWTSTVAGFPVKAAQNDKGSYLVPLVRLTSRKHGAAFPVRLVYLLDPAAVAEAKGKSTGASSSGGKADLSLPRFNVPVDAMQVTMQSPPGWTLERIKGPFTLSASYTPVRTNTFGLTASSGSRVEQEVSRVRAETRSLASGVEAYPVDRNAAFMMRYAPAAPGTAGAEAFDNHLQGVKARDLTQKEVQQIDKAFAQYQLEKNASRATVDELVKDNYLSAELGRRAKGEAPRPAGSTVGVYPLEINLPPVGRSYSGLTTLLVPRAAGWTDELEFNAQLKKSKVGSGAGGFFHNLFTFRNFLFLIAILALAICIVILVRRKTQQPPAATV